jgi:hypothetical protein
MTRPQAEAEASVVQVDARRRLDEPRTEATGVRLDQAHRHPTVVGGAEVRGVARHGRGGAQAGVRDVDHPEPAVELSDQSCAVGALVQQLGPIVRCGGGRLDQHVRPSRLVRVVGDAGGLRQPGHAERQVALRVRADRGQLDTERTRRERLDPLRLGGGEVVGGEQASADCDQPLAERAPVERAASPGHDGLQCQGDPGAPNPDTPGSRLVGELVELLTAGVVEQGERADEQCAGRESRRGETDRRGENHGQVEGPEALVQGDPTVDASRDGDGADVVAQRDRGQMLGAQ